MKKIVLFLCSMTIALFAVACTSQGDGESSFISATSYTITFEQEGQVDVVKTVESGEIVELPQIVATAPTGYTYEWDCTDFFSISSNMTVRLKAVPNTYTIYYDIGDDTFAQIDSKTQAVTFDQEVSLLQPTRFGYKFGGWFTVNVNEPFAPEKYTVAGDTYLVAKWLLDSESDRWFTPDV